MVSVTEAHTTSARSILNQKMLEDEIMVALNGEDTFHCDTVVQEALGIYCRGSEVANRDRTTV